VIRSLSCDGDRGDLDEHAAEERRDSDGGARRRLRAEDATAHFGEVVEVGEVGEVDGDLDDVAECRAALGEDGLDLREAALALAREILGRRLARRLPAT
jgi:hypothetical protein